MGRDGDQVPSYQSVDGGGEDLSHGGAQQQHGDMTSHDLDMNCDTDLGWFDIVVPSGVEGAGLTDEEVGKDRVVEVGESNLLLIKQFSRIFSVKLYQ